MTNVYTIDPDLPFLDTLATELWRRAEGNGEELSRTLIFVPTRRACRMLGNAFTRLAQGKPCLLPRVRPLGDIDEDELLFMDEAPFAEPPAIAPLRRLMLLAQQVKARNPALSWDQAALGADALARFLDEVQIEQCDMSRLPALVEEQDLAAHWQETILFLEIVTKNWPEILKAEGCQDPALRRNALMAAQAELWRKNPPDYPIIAAGSTGSIPATANLLKTIAELPKGAVVLPGLDRETDNEAWDKIDETHPQHSMKKLLEVFDVKREFVTDFTPRTTPKSPRLRLLSEAMRPADVTETWRGLRGQLDKESARNFWSLALDHPQEEAQAIALCLREALEVPHKTAAFVTADRALATRVAALLKRWDIRIDDSGGAPLSSLPPGVFLNLVLAAANPKAGAVDDLALLKHPFAACGLDPAQCRAEARETEIRFRSSLPIDAGELCGGDLCTFKKLKACLSFLSEKWKAALPLSEWVTIHIDVAEAVAASNTESGAARLWKDEAGKDTAEWINDLRLHATNFPPLSGREYLALFASLSSAKILRSARAAHPRLSILGPLEARLMSADLVIIGGLNEGIWPPDVGFDPWMSRPMRKKFKMTPPEYRIGLSAHDFVQLACAKEVLLTRSERTNGTPTVPSRFLLQIEAVLSAAGLSDDKTNALEPPNPWRNWAHALDAPLWQPRACEPPQPRPAAHLRPTSLSVTEISTWLRNPYAIYARHILKLRKLDDLDAELDASDRGNMIHEALEKFSRAFPELPPDAKERLILFGREIFAREKTDPRVRAFWESAFADIAEWVVAEDQERRKNGVTGVMPEAKGKTQIDGLTLTGRADRIEKLADGSIRIIDYKTGRTATDKEVRSGLEPQLQLLALIAAAGGFEGLPPATAASCEYWKLKGGEGNCAAQKFEKDLADLTARAEQGLKNLIAAFADPQTPYEASPRPRALPRFNDYAHLSRLAEWSKTGDDT